MLSLGYGVCDWISAHLPSPADPSRPFILSDHQAAFVVRWYEVDDAGRFIHRRGLLMMPKGWGKSPLTAALMIAEFCGPVLFDGRDASGRPVGRPWGTGGAPPPWVQVAANSEEQATSNTYVLIHALLSANDGRAADALGIDGGRTRLLLRSQPAAKLEAVTAEAGSREGQRVTAAALDETMTWTRGSGGLRLARTIRRNCGKMGGRSLETANAFEAGGGSVAELTADAFDAGEPGILLVANRPPATPDPSMTDEELREQLAHVYAGAPWVSPARIVQEVRDPDTPWSEALRFYFNLPSSATDAFIDPTRWASLVSDEEPAEGERIALGFVGVARDSAALVLCDERHRLGVVEVWSEELPRQEIDHTVRDLFSRFEVGAMFCDPRSWRTEAEAWAESFGEVVIAFPTNSPRRMAAALDRFRVAVETAQVHHDADPDLTAHMTNARTRASRAGHTLEDETGRPITAAVAAVLAFEARARIVEAPPPLEPLVSWV